MIAEGAFLVPQLLRSRFPLRSVLLTPSGLRRLAAPLDGLGVPVYVAPEALVEELAGFHFHRGVLASADRLPLPDRAELTAHARLLLVAEGVNDHENLGSLFRNAAAFGVDAVLLDPTSADPLYRRSVRVSMGHALVVPFTRLSPWPAALDGLRDAGFEVVALTPAAGAEDLQGLAPGGRRAVLVGAEGPGLSPGALAAADRRVRIPLSPGVDSLNLATAAAVALHHLAGEL